MDKQKPRFETWPISKLKGYAKNPRVHKKEDIDKTAAFIDRFGFKGAIIVRSDGEVVDGHLRLKALKKLGWKEVPVVLGDEWTPEEVRAFRLGINRSAEWAEWDEELLQLELAELGEAGFDLSVLDFEVDIAPPPAEGLTDADAVPEVKKDPVSKEGDIWILGKHRLMCGDSTEAANVALLMDGKKADMVFTDPPYGMKLDTDYSSMKNKLEFARDKNIKNGKKYDAVIGDNDDFKDELIEAVFDSFGYCKEIFLWGADYYAQLIEGRNEGSWIVWDKRLEESADKMYGSCFELCWSKAKHKRNIARIKWASVFGTEQEFDHKRHHPTQKPIDLAVWFLDRYAEEGATVADLFGGSGSTLIACEQTGRICRMMEISPHYCDVIIRRWQDFTGQEVILEATGRTFAETAASRGGVGA